MCATPVKLRSGSMLRSFTNIRWSRISITPCKRGSEATAILRPLATLPPGAADDDGRMEISGAVLLDGLIKVEVETGVIFAAVWSTGGVPVETKSRVPDEFADGAVLIGGASSSAMLLFKLQPR